MLTTTNIITNNNKDVSIYCMPDLKWSILDIESSLGCEQKCYTKGIGDGYCDCVNNREHCQYDGGDCCLENVVFLPISPTTCQCIPKHKRRRQS